MTVAAMCELSVRRIVDSSKLTGISLNKTQALARLLDSLERIHNNTYKGLRTPREAPA